MAKRLRAVVEVPEFLRRAKAVGMTETDRTGIINSLAADPEMGVSLGGGLRKARVARKGGGKSGGYRLLYLFLGDELPLFLLTVFAKNEKASITPRERAELAELCDLIAKTYGKTR